MKTLSHRYGVSFAVIVLITLVVYIPAMRAGFIWDDDLFLTKNPLIKADDGLYRFWFTTEPPDYFPLVSSSLWLEWRLWGMNATGYHVVNVVLHTVSAVLLWHLLRRLKIPGAWLAALVFAVHPVNVESVAWITQRKNAQPMVFYLLTILFYLKFESAENRRWYFFALCSHLLALLSKTSVVMLPFVLLGCAWWERGRIARKDLLRSIPFFTLSGCLSLVTVWFQYNVAIAGDVFETGGFFSRLAGAGWAVWFYLYKAILPFKLCFIYPRWMVNPYSVLSYLPLLLLLGCFVIFWWYRRGWGKPLLFGLGYYVVTLFPVLGFFDINFMRFSLVTDHWQYTSIIGIIALVTGLGTYLWAGWPSRLRRLGTGTAMALVALLCILTWIRCNAFKDAEAISRDTISKNPEAWLAHNNLGVAMAEKGRFEEAIGHYVEALRIAPNYAVTHCNLADALAQKGRTDEAIGHYTKALEIKPAFGEAHNNLGVLLQKRGRIAEAISYYTKAVRIMPRFARAHDNLANLLARQGRTAEAIRHFVEVVRLRPNYAEAHNNLGVALSRQGRFKEAIPHFREALRIKPDYVLANKNLKRALAASAETALENSEF